jgi:hypothetical protein
MRLFRAEGSTLRPIRERAGSGPGGKLEKKIKKNRGTEDRIWTRRRPKRTGLWCDKHVVGGKMDWEHRIKGVLGRGMRRDEWTLFGTRLAGN